MTFSVPRTIAGMALAAALMVSLFAAQPVRSQDAFAEEDIHRMVDSLRNGSISVPAVADECRRGLEEDPSAQMIQQFFRAFLEVPESYGLSAFCRAITLAVKDGKVTAEGIALVGRNGGDAVTALEIGRLMRAVYFSHVVTTTASAEGQRPQ